MKRKIILFRRRDIFVLISFFLAFFLVIAFSTCYIPSIFINKHNVTSTADQERLREVVYTLTSTKERVPGGDGHARAVDLIYREFHGLCDNTEFQKYTANKAEHANIICTFNGVKKDLIVVGAHYDTSSITPGADDNASGVASIIELAHMIKQHGAPPEYTIELVAYDCEEQPFFQTQAMGSRAHAHSLIKNERTPRAVIILETIGYFSDQENSQEIPLWFMKPFYPSTGNWIAIVGGFRDLPQIFATKKSFLEASEIPTYSFAMFRQSSLVNLSDHFSY